MTGTVVTDADALERFVTRLFAAAGLPHDQAEAVAEVLVWAETRGLDSHGVFRVPNYLNALAVGRMNPRANLTVATERGATCVLDADRAPGPWAMRQAMAEAIARAREFGVGWVMLRDTTHTGPVGFYARQAVAAGMAGIVSGGSQPIMAYHGSRAPGVSTTPLAIAVPRAGGEPLALDMSTATVPWGKLARARAEGTPLPAGAALDDAGRPTTDPALAAVPLPIAGAKGSGLALMLECLTSLLVGMPLLAPGHAGRARPAWQHGLLVAVDVAAFTDPADFAADAASLAASIKLLPRAAGVDEILMPGERGDRERAHRLRDGIPVDAQVWRQLAATADDLGVTAPKPAGHA